MSATKNLSHKTGSGIVGENHTDIIITEFKNRVFVVVTQIGKIGTIVSASYDATTPEYTNAICSSKVLLGKDEPEVHAVASYLSRRMKFHKPVLYALALKNFSRLCVEPLGNLVEMVYQDQSVSIEKETI